MASQDNCAGADTRVGRRQRRRQEQHQSARRSAIRAVSTTTPTRPHGEIMAANPGLGQTEANAAAWEQGRKLLERAIDQGLDFTFETTLGGSTMPGLLAEAA